LPEGERRPAGIAVDLSSEPPPWRDRADSSEPIVTLRTPLGSKAAFDTVREFFSALVREDISGMSLLVRASALLDDTRAAHTNKSAKPAPTRSRARGGRRGTHSITTLWRERFRKREYHRLASRLVYREADVTTYRREQLDALPISVRYLGPAHDDVHTTDLVLRVPIITHTVRNERLLGNEIVFWLRRYQDRYLIYRMAEDLPF
jgi:hypothetical protein